MDSWTCPHCNRPSPATAQRTIKQHGETIRYRKCSHCGRNFKTVERLYSSSPRTQAIAALLDLNVSADRALNLIERETPDIVLRYVSALPDFQRDRKDRGDPIRSLGGFIVWAIENREPIPKPIHKPIPGPETSLDRGVPAAANIWDRALVEIEQTMTRATFDRWLRGSVLIEHANGHMIVGVQDMYAAEWCATRLYPTIHRTVNAMEGQPVEITFQVI